MQVRYVGNYQYKESATEILGEGTFGIVFKGHHSNDKDEGVALKKISKSKYEDYNLQSEVNIMKNILHPNCVKFIDHVITKDELGYELYHYIITELCLCNLDKYLKDNGGKKFEQFYMLSTAKQLANGYKYLYEKNIMHRDIKLQVINLCLYSIFKYFQVFIF